MATSSTCAPSWPSRPRSSCSSPDRRCKGAKRAVGDLMATALAEAYPRLQRAGIGLVMVTTDSEAQQAAYLAELQLPYLLYCDERRTAVELLGIPTPQRTRQRQRRADGLRRLGRRRGPGRGAARRAARPGGAPGRGHQPADLSLGRSPDSCSPFDRTAPGSRCGSRTSPSRPRRARRCASGWRAAASATPTCTSPGPIGCG